MLTPRSSRCYHDALSCAPAPVLPPSALRDHRRTTIRPPRTPGPRQSHPSHYSNLNGVSEAELIGVLCAWDRMEAQAHARKLAAPKKARERREQAAKDARVERWLQDTGNAALMGCELPPGEALAADEQITAQARELRAAGLEGDMDQPHLPQTCRPVRPRAQHPLRSGRPDVPVQWRPAVQAIMTQVA